MGVLLKKSLTDFFSRQTMDRFITSRQAMDVENANLTLTTSKSELMDLPGNESSYDFQRMLAASLSVGLSSSRILAFKQKAPAPPETHDNSLKALYSENVGQAPPKKQFR